MWPYWRAQAGGATHRPRRRQQLRRRWGLRLLRSLGDHAPRAWSSPALDPWATRPSKRWSDVATQRRFSSFSRRSSSSSSRCSSTAGSSCSGGCAVGCLAPAAVQAEWRRPALACATRGYGELSPARAMRAPWDSSSPTAPEAAHRLLPHAVVGVVQQGLEGARQPGGALSLLGLAVELGEAACPRRWSPYAGHAARGARWSMNRRRRARSLAVAVLAEHSEGRIVAPAAAAGVLGSQGLSRCERARPRRRPWRGR